MRGWSVKWVILVVGTIVLLASIGLQVDLAGMVEQSVEPKQAHAAQAEEHTPAVQAEPTTVENLHCFACHAQGNFAEGGDFPHATHAEEGLVHCHQCHAFEGHFRVTTREETCEECH